MLEVNKFMMEGEQIDFQDAEARTEINTQVARLDGKIDGEVADLQNQINQKATIDDSDITTNKTWSSGQIFAEDNATREIIAILNFTNRAEQNYNAGDLITYNSKLYKVIYSISQGELLTPGTNIQLSKVSTELQELETTCANLQSQINNKATIDDSDITTSKTWSSSKILAEDNSIRENIATLNLTNRAEQNFDVGDLIEWNYKLCKVIAPITQGDLLELGTNLSRTTVANELYQDLEEVIPTLNSLTVSQTIRQGYVFEYNNTIYFLKARVIEANNTIDLNNDVIVISNLSDISLIEESEPVNINIGGNTYTTTVERRGRHCLLQFNMQNVTLSSSQTLIATLPLNYRPNFITFATHLGGSTSGSLDIPYAVQLSDNGALQIFVSQNNIANLKYGYINMQWEV